MQQKLKTGQRVKFPFLIGEGINKASPTLLRGTVVGYITDILSDNNLTITNKRYFKYVLVCLDRDLPLHHSNLDYYPNSSLRSLLEKNGVDYNIFDTYTGSHRRSIIIHERDVTALHGPCKEKTPSDIVARVNHTFIEDGITFPYGAYGKVIQFTQNSTQDQALISWENLSSGSFWTHPTTGITNCYKVPLSNIRFCRIDKHTKEIIAVWPQNSSEVYSFKKGDIVDIIIEDPIFYTKVKDNRERQKIKIGEGAIGKIIDIPKPNRVIIALCGGVEHFALDKEIVIQKELLRPIANPESFLCRGTEIEINADVDFRKINLRGKKAKVILPTDKDGDVGLEFQENLQAGSLDGIGKQGHCLYVQAELLRVSE